MATDSKYWSRVSLGLCGLEVRNGECIEAIDGQKHSVQCQMSLLGPHASDNVGGLCLETLAIAACITLSGSRSSESSNV